MEKIDLIQSRPSVSDRVLRFFVGFSMSLASALLLGWITYSLASEGLVTDFQSDPDGFFLQAGLLPFLFLLVYVFFVGVLQMLHSKFCFSWYPDFAWTLLKFWLPCCLLVLCVWSAFLLLMD